MSRAREDDAPREVTDAASLVEPLPGVHVRRLGGDDSFASMSIRGSTSSEVAILFAGVPLTGGADPSLDLATLPLWPGSGARVYRSFAPAALGPGSLGGTLVLDPPRLGAPPGTTVWAAVGSYGARRVRVGDVRALEGGARVVTGISASRADDDFSYLDPQSGESATRENAGHAAVDALTAWALPVRWSESTIGALTVTAMAQARRQGLPGTVQRPTPTARLDSNRELASAELSAGGWSARAWGRRELARLSQSRLDATSTLGATHDADAIVAAGSSFGWGGPIAEALSLDARLDASAERFAPGAYAGAPEPPGATRTQTGAGADLAWRPIDRGTLAASGRLDAWNDASDTSEGELRPTAHVGGDVALGAFTLAAHAGALARPPSFVERYGDRGAFVGDPRLRPESAWTADAGGGWRARSGELALALDAAAFATWADDLIVFVAQGVGGKALATNIGRARLLGAEADLRAKAGPAELRVAWTALATANESTCAYGGAIGSALSCERPPLPGRPQHDVVADASWQMAFVRLRWGVDVVSGITTDLTGQAAVPPRVLQSAGARVDVPHAPGLRLALDVRNLFDVRAATYDGALGPTRLPIGDLYEYPLPGRTVLVSVRYDAPPKP